MSREENGERLLQMTEVHSLGTDALMAQRRHSGRITMETMAKHPVIHGAYADRKRRVKGCGQEQEKAQGQAGHADMW